MRSLDLKGKVRLYVDEAFAAGHLVVVTGPQAHYLARVMRLGVGQVVRLFNAEYGEWSAHIERVGRTSIRLNVVEQIRGPRPQLGPTLAFGAIKKDGMDFIAIKATELGVEVLSPLMTEYTTVTRVNSDRLRANAIEAAEQCGRLGIPVIDEPRSLGETIQSWPGEQPLFALSPSRGIPIYDVFRNYEDRTGKPSDRPGFLVGPEGGFSPSEEAWIDRTPFIQRITMGERVLRAETAALAVLACWQAILGDWRLN
jgi:16S rRNA (uracil1498-N3)-methyltransferase